MATLAIGCARPNGNETGDRAQSGQTGSSATGSGSPRAIGASTPTPESRPTATPDPRTLQDRLDAYLGYQPGAFGVVVHDVRTSYEATHLDRDRFPLGSLYKLFVMYEAGRMTRLGRLSWDTIVTTPAEYLFGEPRGGVPPNTRLALIDALAAMIGVSSNAAALALIERIGASTIEESPRRIGLDDTAIDIAAGTAPGHFEIDARGSARDITTFLIKLDREELVGPDQDRRMVDLMLDQKIGDRLPRYLPDAIPIAHKTADIDGYTHDAGLVYLPGRPFIVTALAYGDNPTDGKNVVAEVSRLAFEVLSARRKS